MTIPGNVNCLGRWNNKGRQETEKGHLVLRQPFQKIVEIKLWSCTTTATTASLTKCWFNFVFKLFKLIC
jgi:hypothetical protein